MSIVTYSDWLVWKDNAVTKSFMETVQIQIKEVSEQLVGQAGEDSVNDAVMRGYIQGLKDVLEFKVEQEQGE